MCHHSLDVTGHPLVITVERLLLAASRSTLREKAAKGEGERRFDKIYIRLQQWHFSAK